MSGDKKSCTLFALSTDEGSLSEGEDSVLGVKLTEVQKFKLQFAVSPEFKMKFERIKELMSTKNPRGIGFEEAFETLMDEYIERHSPEARVKRREVRAKRREARAAKSERVKREAERSKQEKAQADTLTTVSEKEPTEIPEKEQATEPCVSCEESGSMQKESSRFIPQAIKDLVFKRDGGKCAFTGPDGQRCGSKWNIQVDHIKPFALGGSNSPENLQLLCRRHNQHKAVKDFGKKKMRGHLGRG